LTLVGPERKWVEIKRSRGGLGCAVRDKWLQQTTTTTMQLLSCHAGKLLKVDSAELRGGATGGERAISTGLEALDALLPNRALARGALHEILWDAPHPRPLFFAACLARFSCRVADSAASACVRSVKSKSRRDACTTGRIVWCDPRRELYPPALAAAGISLDQLLLLRPKTAEDEIWALAECLACRGVAATIAQPPPLSRVQVRRLQLAAERGGGAGLLLRPHEATATHHAAATRWLVQPARGERTVQRWKIQLIHGHGGRLHESVYLEYSRDPHQPQADRVRAVSELADRPAAAKKTPTRRATG
jgi:hypothetical protein